MNDGNRQKRLPRTRRSKKAPAIRITDRDIALVGAALKYRFLEVRHVVALFPDDSRQGIYRRLKLLYHHKYLDRIPLRDGVASERYAYAMAEKGARLLAETQGIGREEIPWQRHLNRMTRGNILHYLLVVDLWVALEAAVGRSRQITGVETYPGYALKKPLSAVFRDEDGRRYRKSIVPDLVVELRSGRSRKHLFFLEVDRSTMTTHRFGEKVEVYLEFHRSGVLKERFGVRGFVVLTTVGSEKRMTSLARKAAALKGRRGFWFALQKDITEAEILDKIWRRAITLAENGKERVSLLDIVGQT